MVSVAARAQIVGGSISGLVKDSTGAALRRKGDGAPDRNWSFPSLTTNSDGRFYAPSVPVGITWFLLRMTASDRAAKQHLPCNWSACNSSPVLGVEKLQQEIVVNGAQSSVNTTNATDVGTDRRTAR